MVRNQTVVVHYIGNSSAGHSGGAGVGTPRGDRGETAGTGGPLTDSSTSVGARHTPGADAEGDSGSRQGSGSTAESPREVRRRQRIDLARDQILDTAEELFATRGYHDTGLKDVAARCEFSVGSIYSFFDNKDDLYHRVIMRRSDDIQAIQNSIPPEVPADERLVRLAEKRIQHSRDYPAWGLLTAERSRMTRVPNEDVPESWVEFGRQSSEYLAGVFREGQAAGVLRPGVPEALSRMYYALVTSFILVETMSRMSEVVEAWPSDTEEFLNFLRDSFSAFPRTP